MPKKKLTWKVQTGDCLKLMRAMPAGSVSLVFADPPFNIGYEYDQYDDKRDGESYLHWCAEWMNEVHRVLKPDGTFWLAIGDEYAAELSVMATTQVGGRKPFSRRSWVIWYYTFGVACQKNFSRSHTHLFYFTKMKSRFTFNHDDKKVRVPSARQLKYGDKRANAKGKMPDNTWILHPDRVAECFAIASERNFDTWLASRICGTFGEREERGTTGEVKAIPQMPEEILNRIVLSCSKPGDMVLDPFNGTGTTGVAAVTNGRSYIGYDISSAYVTRSHSRIQLALSRGK